MLRAGPMTVTEIATRLLVFSLSSSLINYTTLIIHPPITGGSSIMSSGRPLSVRPSVR